MIWMGKNGVMRKMDQEKVVRLQEDHFATNFIP